MNKTLLIYFFVTWVMTVYSQDTTTYYWEGLHHKGILIKGERHGTWLSYDDKKRIREKVNYSNGLKDGPCAYWTYSFLNDTVKQVGAFKNGEPVGIWKTTNTFFNQKGDSFTIEYFSDKSSKTTRFKNYKIETEGYQKNNIPIGTWTIYYPSGNKRRQFSYKNGKLSGKMTTWYESGKVLSEANYVDGKVSDKRCWDEKGLSRKCEESEFNSEFFYQLSN